MKLLLAHNFGDVDRCKRYVEDEVEFAQVSGLTMVQSGKLPRVAKAKLYLKSGTVVFDDVARRDIRIGRKIYLAATRFGKMHQYAYIAFHCPRICSYRVCAAVFDIKRLATGFVRIVEINFLAFDTRTSPSSGAYTVVRVPQGCIVAQPADDMKAHLLGTVDKLCF